MASYIVAASVFIIGSSYLFHFVIEPPGAGTAGMDHQALRTNAQTALEVLLGTPGYPVEWDGDVPTVQRLGLIERGTTIRIDAAKFDALARGKLATATADDYIDYAEAKEALGIDGYEFHLRAYPVTSTSDVATYGLEGMETYHVAYIGSVGGVSPTATLERWALDQLNVGFDNATRASNPIGDVYMDDSDDLRVNLLPVIGPTIQQTVIGAGAGTKYDFYRVDASTYEDLASLSTGLTSAMALSSDGETLGYTKNRELRAILGEFPVSGNAGEITWNEFVDTDRTNGTYDCGDYGYVEVSFNNGTSWTKLTDTAADRSQDCGTLPSTPHGSLMTARETSFTCTCTQALLAFHWVGDNDNNIGYGWVVDDVVVMTGAGFLGSDDTVLSEVFSSPEYDMVIIGSDVDHEAFTPSEVKDAMRDYVDVYGGRLLILGGSGNREWLDRLFEAGTGGASGGVATPDTTHPLVTLPNQLSYSGYDAHATQAWTFDAEQASLFTMVMGTSATSQHLAVSRTGAWGEGGSSDGAVIVTSYEPHEWEVNETRKFFANAAVYGKFHYLYIELGPEVPDHEAVASASRSATMNMYRTGEANYTEVAFVLYLWPGTTSADTLASTAVTPTAPRDVSVQSTSGKAWVNWSEPISEGTANLTQYDVWRGTSPTNVTTLLATVGNTTFTYEDTVTNGRTYYYNVTGRSAEGRGTPSATNSTTPLSLPGAPGGLGATAGAGSITVRWTDPATTATGTTFGYRLSVSDASAGTYTTLAEVGNVLSYTHAVEDEDTRYYKVEALNARGYGAVAGPTSAAAMPVHVPIDAPVLSVAADSPNNLTLSWIAPLDLLGQTVESWRIWRAESEGGTYALLASTPADNTSFADVGLGTEITRYYKVQGITDSGEGQNSTEQGATTMSAPLAPTLVGAQAPITNTVTLTITPGASPAAIVRYDVYRADGPGAFSLVTSVALAAATDTPSDSGDWRYYVVAVSAAGTSSASNIVTV